LPVFPAHQNSKFLHREVASSKSGTYGVHKSGANVSSPPILAVYGSEPDIRFGGSAINRSTTGMGAKPLLPLLPAVIDSAANL
jgi:hypothetical protein